MPNEMVIPQTKTLPRIFFGHQGFSLLEMLTVLAISSVLIAFLFPMIGKTRETARSAKCIANLRTIGIAINQYAPEHNDRLPGPAFEILFLKSSDLIDALAPYLNTSKNDNWVWRCPSHSDMNKDYAAYKTRYPFFGYYNAPPKESLASPTRAFLNDNYAAPMRWLLEDIDNWNYGADARLGQVNGPVHSGFRNVLFLDAHVEHIRPTKGQASSLP